jgi:hypothetical protein
MGDRRLETEIHVFTSAQSRRGFDADIRMEYLLVADTMDKEASCRYDCLLPGLSKWISRCNEVIPFLRTSSILFWGTLGPHSPPSGVPPDPLRL